VVLSPGVKPNLAAFEVLAEREGGSLPCLKVLERPLFGRHQAFGKFVDHAVVLVIATLPV
jgi:hypothetical protein